MHTLHLIMHATSPSTNIFLLTCKHATSSSNMHEKDTPQYATMHNKNPHATCMHGNFYFIMTFILNPYISLKVIVSNIHASFNQTFSLKYFAKKFRNNVRGII